MIRFYTLAFFEELARRLNADDAWTRAVGGMDLAIVCSAIDLNHSFLLEIRSGRVVAKEAPPDVHPEFRFEGEYKSWVQLCKGEAEFAELVETGKFRVSGSMPKLMGMMGPLNHIVLVARSFPKEF